MRVLSAITARKEPLPSDVEELRRLDPLMRDMDLDELACDVIQQAVKRRAEIRARLAQQHGKAESTA